jgi:hypothetical protein
LIAAVFILNGGETTVAVVHFGGVHGESKPQGNYLRVEERDKSGHPSGCQVSITLIGPYLVVLDNNRCGGLNVRFSGLWQR